jgi:hypothetical protein
MSIGLRIEYIPRGSMPDYRDGNLCGWKVTEGGTPMHEEIGVNFYDRDEYDIDARGAATEYTKEHYPDMRVRDVVELPLTKEFVATLFI